MKNNEGEKKRERKVLDHECRLRKLSDSLKHNNIHIIEVPEEEDKEKGGGGLLELIIVENFLTLGKETDIEIHETQRTPIKFNKSQPSQRHIIVKFTKYTDKEKILKPAMEKKVLNLQGKTDQVQNGSVQRNLAGQKVVA